MEEWVFLDRIKSYLKLKSRSIPIFTPIFHYSNIPAFQKAAYNLLQALVMRTCLIPVCPD